MADGDDSCGCFVCPIEPAALEHYRQQLGSRSKSEALRQLAEAIAHSDFEWSPITVLVARCSSTPALALLGPLEPERLPAVRAQAAVLDSACRHLRYFSAASVQQLCGVLAERLRERFAHRLDGCRLLAVPRGGWIVATWLAYALGVPASRLENAMQPLAKAGVVAASDDEEPLTLLVDDCLLTGARMLEVLAQEPAGQVVVVALAAPAELCRRLEVQQAQVSACIVASELAEVSGPPAEQDAWQQRWNQRTGGMARVWVGQTEWPCFAWNEPERWVWNEAAGEPQAAWRLLPSSVCSKNLPRPRPCAVRVQDAGEGRRWRVAAEIFFADLGEEVWLGDQRSGRSFRLSATAASMWRALLENDSSAAAIDWLQQRYEAPAERLLADLLTFRGDALERGWLVEGS